MRAPTPCAALPSFCFQSWLFVPGEVGSHGGACLKKGHCYGHTKEKQRNIIKALCHLKLTIWAWPGAHCVHRPPGSYRFIKILRDQTASLTRVLDRRPEWFLPPPVTLGGYRAFARGPTAAMVPLWSPQDPSSRGHCAEKPSSNGQWTEDASSGGHRTETPSFTRSLRR